MAGLGWVPLAERRAQAKVKILYKGKNNMLYIPLDHLRANDTSTRQSSNCFMIPRSKTNTHLHSFYPDTIRLWNGLPDSIKMSASLETFTNKVENVILRHNYKI